MNENINEGGAFRDFFLKPRRTMKNSRYTYTDTDVLINKRNIRDESLLDDFETYHTTKRIAEIAENPSLMDRTFDIEHLKKIHRYIFQDIYMDREELEEEGFDGKLPLRGEFRIENIAKGNFQFANAMFIDNGLRYLLDELKRDSFDGVSFETAIKKLAYYLAEINVLHPFREGNGRTTREFIRQLAEEQGYICDWGILEQKEKQDDFMNAMIFSVSNTSKLERVLSDIVKKA